jgi:peptidoglycan/LPS O-acetylase OafA/YrhL
MATIAPAAVESTPTQAAGTGSTSPRKYAFIDALRGLAFFGVLLHHAVPRVPNVNARVVDLLRNGSEGVQLFFVMSALTLFLSLDSRRRSERRPICNFFIRRFFRIAPLYYAGALFYYFYDIAVTGGQSAGGSSLACIVSTLTFTNGWSVNWINRLVPGGWSIAVEMNFYLLVPWLYRCFRTAEQAASAAFVAFIAGGVISIAAKLSLVRVLGPDYSEAVGLFVWYWLPLQLPVFFAGIFLFFLLRPSLRGRPDAPGTVQLKPELLLAMAGYLVIAVGLSDTSLYLGHAMFPVAFVLLAWSLADRPNALLVNRVTCYLGTVSFSSYLSHFAVLDLITSGFKRLPASTLQSIPPSGQLVAVIAGTLAGTLLISTITYRLIEVPGQELGRRLIRHLEQNATSVELKHGDVAI